MSGLRDKQASYILGYDADERERLEHQAVALEPATRRALRAIDVQPGWHCLDAGCGTGSVMRLLGRRVGTEGHVHGIDIDGTHAARMVQELNGAGSPIYSFETFDLMGGGAPQGAPFDLVFTRLLLIHMSDPEQALRRLWSWVKPGGVLLVLDYDLGVTYGAPRVAPLDDGIAIMLKAFEVSGRNPRIGSEMPHLFERSGTGPADGHRVHSMIVPMAAGSGMLMAVLHSLLPVILRLKIANTGEMEKLLQAIGQSSLMPTATIRAPDLIATWKWKEARQSVEHRHKRRVRPGLDPGSRRGDGV